MLARELKRHEPPSSRATSPRLPARPCWGPSSPKPAQSSKSGCASSPSRSSIASGARSSASPARRAQDGEGRPCVGRRQLGGHGELRPQGGARGPVADRRLRGPPQGGPGVGPVRPTASGSSRLASGTRDVATRFPKRLKDVVSFGLGAIPPNRRGEVLGFRGAGTRALPRGRARRPARTTRESDGRAHEIGSGARLPRTFFATH